MALTVCDIYGFWVGGEWIQYEGILSNDEISNKLYPFPENGLTGENFWYRDSAKE
jgi:hypothetical protein